MGGKRKRQRFCCNIDISLSEYNDIDDADFTVPQRNKQDLYSSESDSGDGDDNSLSDDELTSDSSEDEEEEIADGSDASSGEGPSDVGKNGIDKAWVQKRINDSQKTSPLTEKCEDDSQVLNSEKKGEKDSISVDCPICLGELRDQLVGEPEKCRHAFCFDCIKEWSKNVNSCPVDRLKFNKLFVKSCVNGQIIEELHIADVKPKDNDSDFEDPTFCQICDMGDREDRMLLCDECDRGYHLECLDPPLEEVPSGDWFCPRCLPSRPVNEEVVTVTAYPTRRRRRGARTVQYSNNYARLVRAWFTENRLASREFYVSGFRRRRKRKTRKTDSAANPSRKRSRKKRSKKRKKTSSATIKKSGGAGANEAGGSRRLSMLGSASLEPTLSFSLRGNPFDLDEFCEEPPDKQPATRPEVQKPEPNNPDVLSGIIQGFGSLDPENVTIARDGTLIQKKKYSARRVIYSDSSDSESSSRKREGFDKIKKRQKVRFEAIIGQQEGPNLRVRQSNVRRQIEESSSDEEVANHNEYRPLDVNAIAGNEDFSKDARCGSINDSTLQADSVTRAFREVKTSCSTVISSASTVSQSTDGCRPRSVSTVAKCVPNAPVPTDLKSWRSHSYALEYKPLPAVEDFKSFKIPKVAKKRENSSSEIFKVTSSATKENAYRNTLIRKASQPWTPPAKPEIEAITPDRLTPRVLLPGSGRKIAENRSAIEGDSKKVASWAVSRSVLDDKQLFSDGKKQACSKVSEENLKNKNVFNVSALSEISYVVGRRRTGLMRMIEERKDSLNQKIESKAPIPSRVLQRHYKKLDLTASDRIETSPLHHMRLTQLSTEAGPSVDDLKERFVAHDGLNSETVNHHSDGHILITEEDRALIRKRGISRLQRLNLAESEVKKALKPLFRSGEIDRDEYKSILKKCVEKILESRSSIEASRVERLVWKYICRMRGLKYSEVQ